MKTPKFGARVKVLFDDGEYYWGTINSQGDLRRDVTDCRGKWSVLFDDCTQERFDDGDNEGSNEEALRVFCGLTAFNLRFFLACTMSHTTHFNPLTTESDHQVQKVLALTLNNKSKVSIGVQK